VVDLPRAVAFPHDLAGTPMARFDLLHFVHRTEPYLGREVLLGVLGLYPDIGREEFLRDLAAYRPGKWFRWRLRQEFVRRA
jgi:hypothetical protein